MEILTEKLFKEYSYVSRYSSFPCYYNKRDDRYVNGLTAYLTDKTPYRLHTIERGDTLDNLALHYYNNPTLYWIICSFNHITNPYIKLKEGDQIKIPNISNIEFDVEGRS